MRRLVFILSMLLAVGVGYAQELVVRGVVTDGATGAPLPLVNVQLKGTTTGTVTDNAGKYTLRVPSGDATLIFFYTGYQTQEIAVSGQQEISVVLKMANEEIDQVVVVGYGSARKISSTVGAVATVGGQKLEARPSANVFDALAGQVAGLSILGTSGEPSAGSQVMLHGMGSLGAGSEPLYVLDGVPVSTGTIQGLNPNDYAQVDVLKDASATSIYGSRAANGVIYITTKKGNKQENGIVTARFSYGWSNLVDRRYFDNVLTSKELIDFYSEFNDVFYHYTPAQIDSMHARNDNRNYKWVDYYYRKNAPMHQGDISFASPRGKTTYYLSAGYLYQNGLRMNSKYQKYNVRGNVDSKILPYLRVGLNSAFYHDVVNEYPWSGLDDGKVNFDNFPQIYLPWLTPYDSTGKVGVYMPDRGEVSNEHIAEFWKMGTRTSSVMVSTYLQLEPIKGLTYKVQAGLEAYYAMWEEAQSPDYYWNVVKNRGGFMDKYTYRLAKPTITNTLEYKFTIFNDHHFIPLLGHEYTYSYYDSYGAEAYDIPDSRLMLMQNGDPKRNWAENSQSEYWFNAFFGRLEYNYAERYFIDLTLRNDASSRFGKKHRNGLFWSAGAMWNAKRENFLNAVRWLDRLNVKVSVGTSGNADIGNYTHLATVGTGTKYRGWQTFVVSNPGNPALSWENQLLATVGFDAGFLDMIQVDFQYYYRLTSSMLMDIPTAYSTGYSWYKGNVGKLANQGFDLKLNVTPWRYEDNFVSLYATMNYNSQKVLELFQGKKYWIIPNTGVAYVVGKPVQLFYPLFYQVNPDNGNPQWYLPGDDPTVPQKDPTKVTEELTSGLDQLTGKSQYAPFQGGFGLSTRLWGFYMNADFVFQVGKWMISNDEFFFNNPRKFDGQNISRDLPGNIWKKPGDRAKYPGMHNKLLIDFDSRLIKDASFLRMRNFTFGYDVPAKWLKYTKAIRAFKVYASFRNLFTLTKFKGADPELPGNLQIAPYTNTKQYSVGVEIQF